MRLLFLTSRFPYPPNRGDRLRVFNFIRRLSSQHEIHLVSFISERSEMQYIPLIKEYCQEIHTLFRSVPHSILSVGFNIWRKLPFQTLYYRSTKMQAIIDALIDKHKFDAIYVHLFRMVPYVSKYNDLYRIVDLTDVISQELIRSMPYRNLNSRLLYSFEQQRIEKYEIWVAQNYEESWLVSDHDRKILAQKCPESNIRVVRNGVDTELFYPTGEQEIPNQLIMVGHMGVFHNVDAAEYLTRDIFPLVRAEIPDVHIKIVGTSPNKLIRSLSSIPGVEVTGFVPDLNKVLNQAAVFVAPLRFAAGIQNKVLEAMAAGKPVVTTNLVNNGLGALPYNDLITADTTEGLAKAIIILLKNEVMRNRIGLAARKYVIDHYHWDSVADRIDTIQKVAGKSRN